MIHVCIDESGHQLFRSVASALNSLAPGRSGCNSKNGIFNLVLLIGIFRSPHDNALCWMPLDLTYDKSTLVQVMAWCRQATSHYLSQCWPRSLSPYGIIRPQVKSLTHTIAQMSGNKTSHQKYGWIAHSDPLGPDLISKTKQREMQLCAYFTYWLLVMPHGNKELGWHRFMLWLVAWWYQAITWTNVDFSSVRLHRMHHKIIWCEKLKIFVIKCIRKLHFWYFNHIPQCIMSW